MFFYLPCHIELYKGVRTRVKIILFKRNSNSYSLRLCFYGDAGNRSSYLGGEGGILRSIGVWACR
jgi:hypothetical protein